MLAQRVVFLLVMLKSIVIYHVCYLTCMARKLPWEAALYKWFEALVPSHPIWIHEAFRKLDKYKWIFTTNNYILVIMRYYLGFITFQEAFDNNLVFEFLGWFGTANSRNVNIWKEGFSQLCRHYATHLSKTIPWMIYFCNNKLLGPFQLTVSSLSSYFI